MTAWQPNPYSWALLASALVSAAIGGYAWTRRGAGRQSDLARRLALAMAAATVWTAAYGIALGVHELEPRIFWAKVQHLGIAYIPPNLLAFACAYVGREELLAGGRRLALAIPPLLDVLLAWTNELHGLIWRSIELIPSAGAATLRITYGHYFWLYTAYSYVVLLLGLTLLARTALRAGPLQRGQSRIMALGASFPWLGNLLYLTGASPFGRLDLTPFGYTLTGAALAWGLFRYRLLNLVPIARDRVVESMSDGFIVLDQANQLLDLNPPAAAILGASAAALIGKPVSSLPPAWSELIAQAQAAESGQRELTISQPHGSRSYEIRFSQLARDPLGGGAPLGKLIMLQDITDRKHARDVRAAVAQRELQLARNIQLSLLPQEPPRLPGMDIAALSIPTSEVGGDLYAFHDLPALEGAPAGYGFALGDVSGKGVPAALYMAISTTLLAGKAPFVADTARLLGELNGALQPQMAPTRMNLALCYARLSAAAGGGYRGQIASAGMVAPLLRRAGSCALLEITGLPLGILADPPAYRAHSLDLLPGDLLILYSDGLVEARDQTGALYGFERLLDCVERAPAGDAPGAADLVLQWILADVYGFMGRASQHDDLTLMVLQLASPSGA